MVSKLIERITLLQSHGNDEFPSGMFESFRENRGFLYTRSDSNVFGSISVGYLLNSLKPWLTVADGGKVDVIISQMRASLELYKNKDGLNTYNFWQTKPSQHFPNGYLMKHFRHFKLPDDVDDTSLVYMTRGYSSEEAIWLKEKLQQHAFPNRIYSTWFGLNMPLEMDVCALCNLMCLLLGSKASLNEYDVATLKYLNRVIVSKDFLTNTFWISRHYGTVPLIIYHYARLLGQFEIAELAEAQEMLLDLIPDIFKSEDVWMNKVLLQTAYFKLKENRDGKLEWNALEEPSVNNKKFYSFIGAPFAPLKNSFLRKLGSRKMLQISWKCEAHELALVLENLVLRENYLKG